MTRTLSEAFGWLRRQALSYLLIVAILAAGGWLMVQYRSARSADQAMAGFRGEMQRLELQLQQLTGQLPAFRARILRKLGSFKAVHESALLLEREKELERARYERDHRFKSKIPGTEPYVQLKLLDGELVALRLATSTARNARLLAEDIFRSAQAVSEYEREASEKRAQSQLLLVQWHELKRQSGWRSGVVFTRSHVELNRLKGEIERLDREANLALKRIEFLRSAAATDPDLAAWLKLLRDVARARAGIDGKRANLAEAESVAASTPYRRMERLVEGWLGDIRPTLLAAGGVLLLAIFGRIVIKVIMYYVVAPIASRGAAIRLLPTTIGAARSTGMGTVGDEGRASAVSVPIRLRADQELMVLPEFLQSSSLRAEKRTKWLLNASIPWSSLLSGMYMLTRVRSPVEDDVVVSATRDPLSELCLIDLPEGAAFVCQPRSLAGVVQNRNRPIRITRHWRLGSFHAWLTLQLRFLVFHGPGQLIVKGCRGVRMERAGRGRLINQAATLGFDANLDYANTRCETFVSYWSGKDNLFNDLFTGAAGSYVYEEVPDLKHKSGINGRGLEGIFDAALKVFGV